MKTNKAHMLSDKELRSLQMVLLEMLLEIDRVCCHFHYQTLFDF